MSETTSRSAITTICTFNINSFKENSDDRTSDLNILFNNVKAQIYIITETKLTKETAIKFNKNYLGMLWKHSVTTTDDASAGISIAYDPLLGTCDLIILPPAIQNRTIAIRFTPPNAEAFIILGIYAPASGTVVIKRSFIDHVFATRSNLQQQYNCNIIMGGDFNSSIGHLESCMRDYRHLIKFKPDSIANAISSHMSECGYVHPFESLVQLSPARQYLTFQCTTDKDSQTISAKGIDHLLFPETMLHQLGVICISKDFFSGSKHKPVSIAVKNLMTLPISTDHNPNQFIPPIVWNDPDFCNESNIFYTQYILDHKDHNNSNWDALMSDIKLLALRSKKNLLRNLTRENEIHPTPETKAKISQFLPSKNRTQSQWDRSVSNTIPHLMDVNGNLTSSHNNMCSIAAKHFETLFQNKDTCSEKDIEDYLSNLDLKKFTTEEKEILSQPFTLVEFSDIIKGMPAGKSTGKDNIPIDIFKNSVDLRSILLACANNTFLRNQPLPESLRSVLFRLIPKDPDHMRTDLDNYRPIGLLPIAYRIISKVVTTRIQPMLSRLIGPHQYAYVNGRRSENIGRIISELMMQTISDPNFSILTLKLDFRKAFDSVSFQYIRSFLNAIDTPNLFINFIMHILTNLNGAVIINNGFSATFPISRGTTQGSALSAILFVLCLEGLCQPAISNPITFGAASLPHLNLSVALMAFADDMNIFTAPQCITAWLNLLADWGSLSGVTLNIPKGLLNFWSRAKNPDNISALQQTLINHPCKAYRDAGIFNILTNVLGWRIGWNEDFKLLGISYSFKYHLSDFDTKTLLSFSSNTWNLKNPLLPDPRIKLASALHAASDNMFDRLIDLKTLFVSGYIFRLYNCPCDSKTMASAQNLANVVMLSPSALRTPYIKLNTLFKPISDGGCHHVSIQSIQNSISVHTIILLLSGMCDIWVLTTYRRDLLRIVMANCSHNDAMKFLPYDAISHASLHYLFGLPLISSLVFRSDMQMLWVNYASISNFISLPKNTISNLTKGNNNPTRQELYSFNMLLLEPLWLNKLFVNPTTSKSISPTSHVGNLGLFRDIWSLQLRSFVIPIHETTCSATCSHDHNCRLFWESCIPPLIAQFAEWCSPHYMHIPPNSTQVESTMFTLQIHPTPNHDAIPLPECSVKILTAYYTSIRASAGPADPSLITGVCGWIKHWPQHTNSFTWKAYFELIDQQEIDKSARDAYWKLLHRCHIPRAKNTLTNTAYVRCKNCAFLNTGELFNPEHAIFGCPVILQFWERITNYILKINQYFDQNISFLTIISLGLHNMENSQDCPFNIRTATYNIIGLGIKALTTYPIESSNSIQMLLVSFRQQFRNFIKNAVEAKINAHLSKYGPNQEYYPALRNTMALELSIWTIIFDKNPASLRAPTWSDYTYVDPV